MRVTRKTSALIGATGLLIAVGCSAPPTPVAAMRNPVTGQTVVMYRENPLKVPISFGEAMRIEDWKAEQREKGFTEDAPVR